MLRAGALGSFYDLLVRIAQDPAMLVWLDGRDNVKDRPQENFAREVMEIFSMGVGTFTEDDVSTGARVFTGWNLRLVGASGTPKRYVFVYNAAEHDAAAKTFSFPIYGGTKQDHSGALGGRRTAGRLRSPARARPASGDRAAARPAALRVLRRRERTCPVAVRAGPRERVPPVRAEHDLGDLQAKPIATR